MASFSLKKNKVMLLPRHVAEPQTEKKNKIITQDKNAQELINSVQIKTLHNSARYWLYVWHFGLSDANI